MVGCTPVLAPSQNAAELLQLSREQPRFSSSCTPLDHLITPLSQLDPLHHGLEFGSVLELTGPPGSGKTRCALGFVLAARFWSIEHEHEHELREVLVIDTEGSLSPHLIHQTAQMHADHNRFGAGSATAACDGVHHQRVYDLSVLIATLVNLPTWLEAHPLVRLVVIDSLSTHLRPTSIHSYKLKEYIWLLIQSTLVAITAHKRVSVVLTTYMSGKLYSTDGSPAGFSDAQAEALMVPQLGTHWIPPDGELPVTRVVLHFGSEGERLVHLMSSPKPTLATSAAFAMDALGPTAIPEHVH